MIAKKDAKLNRLSEAAERRGQLGQEEAATLETLREETTAAEVCIVRLVATAHQALEAARNEAQATAAHQAVEYIVQRLMATLDERGFAVSHENLQELISPSWLPQAQMRAKAQKAS